MQRYRQERAMFPFQFQQAQLGVQSGQLGLEAEQFRFGQERAMAPYQLGQAQLGLEAGQFRFGQERQMAPFQLRSAAAGAGMGELGLERGRYEFGEFKAGEGLRAAERGLGEAQTRIGMAAIGDVRQAGQRAYTLGREREELERLSMASQAQRMQSQMKFMPQMEALRGGIMGRMAGKLGVALPNQGRTYESGTGYTPSWMQSYQAPSFPRY